jgi:hypothetical protein
MDLVVFSPSEIVPVLRALRGVALANHSFTRGEADLVEGVGRLHGVEVDAGALDPIAPAEIARAVTDPHRRKRVVQLAIVTALVEGSPAAATDRALTDLARALDVPEAGVRTLHDLAGGHALLARFDVARRMQTFLRRDGLPGFFKAVLPPLLGLEDAELAGRYHALARCAEGTLGRAFHAHYAENDFKFPGEAGGMPERMIFHDVGHVLSGYGVDPQSEIQQAAFQAGFVRKDGFLFLLFGILQFHVGLRLTPIAQAETGLFDVPRVLRAAARGARCKVDLSDGFDLLAHAHEPLDALRARLDIEPLEEERGAKSAGSC